MLVGLEVVVPHVSSGDTHNLIPGERPDSWADTVNSTNGAMATARRKLLRASSRGKLLRQ